MGKNKVGRPRNVSSWGLRMQIRIEQQDGIYVQQKGCGISFNASMNRFIGYMREIEAEALSELCGYFQPNEWKFLANVLKDDPHPIVSKNELVRRIVNVKVMEALSSFYQVKPAELTEKIQGLNCCHVFALTTRIHEYWAFGDKNGVDINEWAKY